MATETTAGPMIEWVRREGRPNEGGDRTYFPTSVIFEKARRQDELHAEMLVALEPFAQVDDAAHVHTLRDAGLRAQHFDAARTVISKAKEAR